MLVFFIGVIVGWISLWGYLIVKASHQYKDLKKEFDARKKIFCDSTRQYLLDLGIDKAVDLSDEELIQLMRELNEAGLSEALGSGNIH